MRSWIFHPWVFYPLAALIAAGAILLSASPQSWPRDPAPQTGSVDNGQIVLQAGDFDAPMPSPEQEVFVTRNWRGEAQTLRVAVKPEQPEPGPSDTGVRVLLAPETAALVDGLPVIMEVTYRSLPVNTANGLAATLVGAGPATWAVRPIEVGEGVVRYGLAAQTGANAIGLRAIGSDPSQNTGVEILSIRLIPPA